MFGLLGNGIDYSSTPIKATFAAESTSTTVNVSVIKDDIVESSETFNLNIMIPSSLSSRVLPGRLNETVGRITDSTGKLLYNNIILLCV